MKKYLQILIVLLGWFAVIVQFVLMYENKATSTLEMIIRFFSFFTILTNLLVSVYFTYRLFNSKKGAGNIFKRNKSLTAITVYITVVGLVYQVALRHIWHPTGIQMLVDELLHSIIPILVIIYWFKYDPKLPFAWSHIPKFLLYPLLYLVFILVRGAFSGFYPYPFMNAEALGWPKTISNILLLFCVFTILFILFMRIKKASENSRG